MFDGEGGEAGDPTPWRDVLAAKGRSRLPAFLSPEALARLTSAKTDAAWTERQEEHAWFEQRVAHDEEIHLLQAAFQASGLAVGTRVVWLRHGPGRYGLPDNADGQTRWMLDFNEGWRSAWGGLLLFVDDGARAEGWRPEAGSLTVFAPEAPPVLTLVAPWAGQSRLALTGVTASSAR